MHSIPPDAERRHRGRTAKRALAHYATISYRLGGQKLGIDPKTEQIIGNADAMKLFKREYRNPYEIGENV